MEIGSTNYNAYLIRDAIHVSWVKLPGLSIDQVVCCEHGIPSVDKIHRHIISGRKIAVHAQKPSKGVIDAVVKRSSIERLLSLCSEEVFVVGSIGQH